MTDNSDNKNIVWEDKKRTVVFGLPITFTEYRLTDSVLYIDKGLLGRTEDEVRLYRITDLRLTQSLWQRILGTGTIHIASFDNSLGNFNLVNIKDSKKVKDMLSDMVEHERQTHHVISRESAINMHG